MSRFTDFFTAKKVYNFIWIGVLLFFGIRYINQHHISPALPITKHTLNDEKDNSIDFNDFKGKYLLISYFQTWCGDCIRELPHMEGLQKKVNNDKLQILLISDEGWEKISTFKTKYNDRLPYFLSSKPLEELGINVFPTTYLLSPDGKILLSKLEQYDWSQQEVVDLIK